MPSGVSDSAAQDVAVAAIRAQGRAPRASCNLSAGGVTAVSYNVYR